MVTCHRWLLLISTHRDATLAIHYLILVHKRIIMLNYSILTKKNSAVQQRFPWYLHGKFCMQKLQGLIKLPEWQVRCSIGLTVSNPHFQAGRMPRLWNRESFSSLRESVRKVCCHTVVTILTTTLSARFVSSELTWHVLYCCSFVCLILISLPLGSNMTPLSVLSLTSLWSVYAQPSIAPCSTAFSNLENIYWRWQSYISNSAWGGHSVRVDITVAMHLIGSAFHTYSSLEFY